MTEKDDECIVVSTETLNDDYDSPWKHAVEHYFPEFIAFYFPEASAEIDWSKEHVFLDQELRAVVQDAELGKRFVDKLVRVTLLNGYENWIYIHIEVQGAKQAEFAERMFIYNYRLYDHYRRPIASMAVLADKHEQWKPTSYGFEVLGCKHTWLDQQVWHEIETIEESKKMQYITSVERIGIAKGRQEGRLEGESRLLRKLLECRFGVLPTWASDKLNSATEQDLESWGEAVLTAPTLDAVFDNDAVN